MVKCLMVKLSCSLFPGSVQDDEKVETVCLSSRVTNRLTKRQNVNFHISTQLCCVKQQCISKKCTQKVFVRLQFKEKFGMHLVDIKELSNADIDFQSPKCHPCV
ncbi:CLUMA_CG006670, isoform A [Clunio marinus]|uniref:CLUMA_CG006670, isoform A n=1 Tax=Clunio marinus TaxID=568069 RepID=A0A1J1I287_9DIPT|nr:CLUMA_CG006670, isoform A [Clunio marinus]